MNLLITLAQIIVSVLLAAAILLQAKGAGIGGAFGGSSSFVHTRRGSEKILFRATFILAFLFVVISIANILV